MLTKWKLIRPDGSMQEFEQEVPKYPGYDILHKILTPLLNGGDLEHIAVWADYDFDVNYKPLDMFADENGLSRTLPRNEVATWLYRRAALIRNVGLKDPEQLSHIVGPAVLFSRRVWF